MLIFAMKYYHCTTIGSRVKTLGGFSPFSPPIYTLGMSWLMELSYTLEYYHAVWDEYIRGQIGGGEDSPSHFRYIASGRLGERWHRSDPRFLVAENDGEKKLCSLS